MTFILPKLNYAYNALEPSVDAKTMEIHHTKHHQAYIDNLNKTLEKYPQLQGKKVEELLADNLKIVPEEIKIAVRNNGGGHFNHSFFWQVLYPERTEIDVKLLKEIESTFGSFDKFKELFKETALKRFGSGWIWLVLNNEKLEVYSTANQDSPLMEGKIPLLGLDVWEHAYYLKYMNKRADYVDAFWNIVNWKFVSDLFNNN